MTMRAFAIDEFGAPGSVHELPVPEPGEGEILVAIKAAGVNRMDPSYVGGMAKERMEHRFPLVPGIDLAGVVEKVGPHTNELAVGDEVYGVSYKPFVGAGTFAEYAVVGADGVAPKPKSLTFTEAAAVPLAGLTALAAVEAIDPRPGGAVVIVGPTGGVGSFATRMTIARGARVVAVSAADAADQARSLGAADVIDYQSDVAGTLAARYPDGIDGVIATYGDIELIKTIAKFLKPGGVVSSPAVWGDGPQQLEAAGITFKAANRLPADRLHELTALFDGGQLKPAPVTTYPLEAAGDAIATIAAGHARGKLVIAVR